MVQFDLIAESEISKALTLIREVFLKFEAPDYSDDGVREFLKYVSEDKLYQRIHSNHFCLVAKARDQIVGVIEVRDLSHVSLLFVHANFHRQGIGRSLWLKAFTMAQERDKSIRKFTVNSSPFAMEIYKRLGFQNVGPEKEVNGIRFFPMEFIVQT